VEAVEIPVSADLEAGYGSNTEEIVASVEAALDCGIVGINLEDGTADPENPLFDVETMQERIAAIRAAAKKRGLPLVINARTDVFLTQAFAEEQRLPQAIERGNRFRESGADCVFVPGGLTQEAISELVAEIDAPLNVVANPAISIPVVPDVKELQDLGVARVSVGSGVLRATLAYVQRIAAEVLHTGIYQTMQQELEAANAPLAYQRAIGRSPGRQWTLWRQDDHGNRFAVESFSIRSLAQARLREFESRSHHQVYWLESSASEQP
jgi:2-methylisocitrate lyase-like PEP mutase family enzyme